MSLLKRKLFLKPSSLLIVLAALLFLLFFETPILSFFSQDDFYHLREVMNVNFANLPRYLLPGVNKEQTFYRPLSREFYNFWMFNIFGLRPLAYHLMNSLLILIIAFLTYLIVRYITKEKIAAVFSAILYLFSAVHSIELYYLSSIQTLLSTIFSIISILAYGKYLDTLKVRYLIYATALFFLSIVSHESAASVLLIIILMEFFQRKKFVLKRLILRITPFLAILLVRFSIFSLIIGIPSQTEYKPSFELKDITNSLAWFTIWCLGLPEMLTDFVTFSFKINPNLIKWYGYYLLVVIPMVVLIILLSAVILVRSKKIIFQSNRLFFLLACFLSSLIPFLFFPHHKFVYYLSFPVTFFSAILGYIFFLGWREGRKLFVILIMVSFLIISYQTTSLNKLTHWSAKRSVAAKSLIEEITKKYPKINKGQFFYFVKDPGYPLISNEWGSSSKQAFYILSGSDALQLYYNDQSIRAFFEDVNEPKDLKGGNIIKVIAKFPY